MSTVCGIKEKDIRMGRGETGMNKRILVKGEVE
jgi:hypothetical protein